MTALKFSGKGLAVRMSFSTSRSHVNIAWKASKRLTTGSLIAVTPSEDMFQTFIMPGVVAARPLALVDKAVPEIEIFLAYDTVIDPSIEYVIVEETNGFFEAQRYNLVALQKMTDER